MSINNRRDIARHGISVRELFPRSVIAPSGELTPYQRRKAIRAIREKATQPDGTILAPDRPDYYALAGFVRGGDYIYPASQKIKIHTLYYAEGGSEFYSANTTMGDMIHAQLIPAVLLPQYLEELILIEEDNGREWYDKITIRESDRQIWGGEKGLTRLHDTPEEFLLWLSQYMRHGAPILGDGAGGETYSYIQVVFIKFQY